MAGPYPIINDRYTVGVPRWGQPPRCGPYEYDGKLYAFVANADTAFLVLVKSTNNGATWTEVLSLDLFAGTPDTHPAIVFNTCPSISYATTPIVYVVAQTQVVDFLSKLAVASVNLATESVVTFDTAGTGAGGVTYLQPDAQNDDLFIEQASDGTLAILAQLTYLGVGGSGLYPRRTVCMLIIDAGLSGFSAPVALGNLGAGYNSVGMGIVRTPAGGVRGFIYEWHGAAGLGPGTAYYVDIVDNAGHIGGGSLTSLGDTKLHYWTASSTAAHTFAMTSDSFNDTGTPKTFDETDPIISGAGITPPAGTGAWCVGWWDGDFWNAVFSNTENGLYLSSLDGTWATAEQILSSWNYYLSGNVLSDGVALIYTPDDTLTNYQAWFFKFNGGGDCCQCLPHGAWGAGAG